MQTTIQVRVDEEIREKAAKVFQAMGTDLSGGIKLFLNQVVNEGSLGFEPMTKDGLKFKHFQEHKRQLAREREVWKKLYEIK
ncbi:MAG: type II toxin-antitoxin system RelB/DinJ family antitoxin [Candidatus Pacebacteria bacterium]|nr:type II toxin-antitoxin system RelB/DinJ family antitoxin [Candidatus Paceibacterota bacterium]